MSEKKQPTSGDSRPNEDKHAPLDALAQQGWLDYITDGIVVFDAQMNYLYLNRRAGELLGRDPEDLRGKNYWKEYPEAAGSTFDKAYQTALKTRQFMRLEDYYAPFDRWFENRIYPTEDGLLILFTEITEQKKAELALKNALQRNNLILETTLDGYLLFDTDGRILEANPAYCQMSGYSHDELLQMNVRDIQTETPPEEFPARIERLLAVKGGRIHSRHRTKDGRIIDLDVSLSIISAEKGPLIAAFMRDITRQIEQEKAIKEDQALLRALTARLSAAQEEERRRLARELHDQIGQNLTAIHLLLETSQASLPPESPVAATLAKISQLVTDTSNRVRGVMTALRPPVLDDYGLLSALHWYAEEFSSRNGITVQVDGTPLDPRPTAEVELHLFRIVQEALNNVIKHARATQIQINLFEEADRIRLTITDNGQGFKPHIPAAPQGAKGWGLVSMRERAEILGGQLTIQSEPGKGTSIQIEMPR